jgi:hypothetical protein
MSKNWDFKKERFEFMFKINGHPVCQRYFKIYNYNEDFKNSIELKEMLDSICGLNIDKYGSMGIIPEHLKKKSVDILWERHNPYMTVQDYIEYYENLEESEKDDNKENNERDIFTFEFKVDGKVVGQYHFENVFYKMTSKHQIDIRPIIKDIIDNIIYYTTLEELNMVTE